MKHRLFLVLCIAACATEDDSEVDAAMAGVEGIYAVQAYTRNEAACEPGGASALRADRFAIATRQEFLGHKLLTVVSCASSTDCRTKLADIRGGGGYSLDFSFTVDRAGAGGVLNGNGVSTGFGSSGTCRGAELTATTLELLGARLSIEQRITIADDYPADSEGFCTTDLARKHAEGNACTQMAVLTADLVEVL